MTSELSVDMNPYLMTGAILYQVSIVHLPTFILNSQIQMITSADSAAQIAEQFCKPGDSITVMSYATGVVECFTAGVTKGAKS